MSEDGDLNAWVLKIMQDELMWRQSNPDLLLCDTQGPIASYTDDLR